MELPNALPSMYQVRMTHRPACFESHSDKAPLADLCNSWRDTLQGILEQRLFCSICQLTIMKGELYFVAEVPRTRANRNDAQHARLSSSKHTGKNSRPARAR